MRAWRLACVMPVIALGLSGCADINWQATYDTWAKSVCRAERGQC